MLAFLSNEDVASCARDIECGFQHDETSYTPKTVTESLNGASRLAPFYRVLPRVARSTYVSATKPANVAAAPTARRA